MLILDVATRKYPYTGIQLAALWAAMNTVDSDSGQSAAGKACALNVGRRWSVDTTSKPLVALIEAAAERLNGAPSAPIDAFRSNMQALHLHGREGVGCAQLTLISLRFATSSDAPTQIRAPAIMAA